MPDTRQEALRDLLDRPGWALFVAHVSQEWGPGGRRFEGALEALADQTAPSAQILAQMQQIAVARREILRLLSWPQEEVKRQDDRPDLPTVDTRRQPSGLALAESRRGGL